MNRKEAAELMPIIQAFLEGRTIERKTRSWEFNKGWRDETQWEETEELICRDTFVYRIKPEPKFRPFKDAEECWCEMLKHEPFGWTCDTFNIRDCIVRVTNSGIVYEKKLICFEDVFNKCSFVDGTPFGVKVEE